MDTLIICAGMGTRLKELTKDTNKCLFKIGEKSIISTTVDTLKENGIEKVYTVLGYCAEQIEEELKGKVNFLYNPKYATTGLLASVIEGKEKLVGKDFLLMAGDSIMHPQIIKEFINTQGQVLVSVELKKCDEEDVKAVIKLDKIIKMSKEVPIEEASGEFTSLIKIPKESSKAFFEEIEEFIKLGSQNKYIANIVMFLQDRGFDVKPVYTNHPRIEVDYPEDLEKAREMFRHLL
ncbi:MAG: phosphocholine cytidylyltransferase family protein [Nanoarchaeota archaeon]|nr:phosphocholine cytidylyltransferase family protein [Nanoarchaeota archaeon]